MNAMFRPRSELQQLRVFYILALAFLVILFAATHIVVDSLNGAIESDGRVINVAGWQRTLNQRIASRALQLRIASAEDNAAELSRLREALDEDLALWLNSHTALLARDGSMGLQGSNTAGEAAALRALTPQMEDVGRLVDALYVALADGVAVRDPVVTEITHRILETGDALMPALDANVQLFESNLAQRVGRIRIAEKVAYFASLLILGIVALFMFEPAIRRLQRHGSDIATIKTAVDVHPISSVTDRRRRITDVNEGFCRISGYSRSELIGQNHRMLNSGHHPREFWSEMWRTITAGRVWRAQVCNRAKDGSLYWVDSTNVPQLDEKGRIDRVISWRFDITEQKRAEEEANRATDDKRVLMERLEHGLQNSGIGLWDLDLEKGTTYFNGTWYTMLGYEPDELPANYDTWEQLLHPDDMQATVDALDAHTAGATRDYEQVMRMRRKDGGWQWIRTIGRVTERADDGEPLRIIGVRR